MDIFNLRTTLLLTIQSALLREISPNIRGITCGWDESKIMINFYFDGDFTEEEQESMECVATEVIASIPDRKIDVKCIRIDVPDSLTSHKLLEWVYLRKEIEGILPNTQNLIPIDNFNLFLHWYRYLTNYPNLPSG